MVSQWKVVFSNAALRTGLH